MGQLPKLWPSTDFDQLVANSEGLLIWASTLVKSVDDGLLHKWLRLANAGHRIVCITNPFQLRLKQ